MSTEIPLDNDTRAALLLFNERLEATALRERGEKRVAKAERAKEQAAATVRKLSEDSNATAEEKAEAEAAYKAAVDEYNVIRADPTAGLDTPKKSNAPADDDSTASTERQVESEAPQEDAPLAETSADEEPPAEVKSSDESD